jgi:GWxTD domain-containing protein
MNLKIKILFLTIFFVSLASGYERDFEDLRFTVNHRIKPSSQNNYGQLDITIKIPNKSILFKKSDDVFEGRIDVTISLLKNGKKVGGDTWFEIIQTDSYQETVAGNKYMTLSKSYEMPADDLNVIVYITDIFTQRKGKQEFKAALSMFKDVEWSFGEVFPSEDPVRVDSTKHPPVSYIRFVFSAAGKEGREKFTYRIFRDGKKIREGYFFVNMKITPYDYYFPVSIDELNYQEYILELSTIINGQEVKRSTPFQIRWENMPSIIHDIDLAIAQMRYLRMTNFILPDEYKRMQNAQGDDQKELFLDFWKRKDPSPTTDQNEVMNEYYHRVELSNRLFSGFRKGWESDRGMIYIIFGEPDDVEQHSFDIAYKPYIIWYYHNLNRRFVFMDYTGFGDYQLTDPVFDLTY